MRSDDYARSAVNPRPDPPDRARDRQDKEAGRPEAPSVARMSAPGQSALWLFQLTEHTAVSREDGA
jgi:hypothetical protein